MNALSKRQFLKLSLASGVALSLSACGGGDEHDIVDVLSDYPEYSLLVEAVQAAGLVDTLKGRGPFTVFAPTNTAFVNLLGELETTKDALFANKGLLTTVLTYHVLGSRVPAADIPFGRAITTVETGIFKIDNVGGPVITDERNRIGSSRFGPRGEREIRGIVGIGGGGQPAFESGFFLAVGRRSARGRSPPP